MRDSISAPNARPSLEFKVVAVMALGFGLVGIDRFLIATMFPVIARDLHLSYADIGVITGALAIAWGASALFTGHGEEFVYDWSLEEFQGWYDLVITVEQDPTFKYRFAGHIETGRESISDPAMGGLVTLKVPV